MCVTGKIIQRGIPKCKELKFGTISISVPQMHIRNTFFLEGSIVTTKKTAPTIITNAAAAATTSLAAGCSHSSVHIQKKIPI